MSTPEEQATPGTRTCRLQYMDDGTWRCEGDMCLAESPLKYGTISDRFKSRGQQYFAVDWDDGRSSTLLSHGFKILPDQTPPSTSK